MRLQAALRAVYPPQCLSCDAHVTTDFGLCGPCWRETAFVTGLVCDRCGTPLPGEDPGHPVQCDDCIAIARPWARGRAALLYQENGRRLVLLLKHGDRTDLARPAAIWMQQAAQSILLPGMVLAPIPAHWTRFLRRRYNQAALLSSALARLTRLDHCPDLLLRPKRGHSQEGRDRDGRFRNVEGAFRICARNAAVAVNRPVLLVDDVMTSGATLAAAAETCLAAGASSVSVLVMARVAKNP